MHLSLFFIPNYTFFTRFFNQTFSFLHLDGFCIDFCTCKIKFLKVKLKPIYKADKTCRMLSDDKNKCKIATHHLNFIHFIYNVT